MNQIKFLIRYSKVDVTEAKEIARAEARLWIKAHYPNEPRWTDLYKSNFQAFVSSYLNAYRVKQAKLSA